MSWFGDLVETYGRLAAIVGIPDENGSILLPPGHMAANTDVCVVIDGDGNFRRASEGKENICIPCTEDSSKRSGLAKFPHPLHDQIGYLSLDEKKRAKYLAQLGEWKELHQKLGAVYNYVLTDTLIGDLNRCRIKTGNANLFIRFSVEIPGDLTPELWKDASVAEAWQGYCDRALGDETLCYATGETAPPRLKHPAGIILSTNKARARLISCNDNNNYTFRGRFLKSEQANAISGRASHAAHAMLRYLIATHGYKCASQAIVAWTIDDGSAALNPQADTLGLYLNESVTDRDALIAAKAEIGYNFAKNLRSALSSKGNAKSLFSHGRQVAILSVDAISRGRIAVTFYTNLSENDYIDRIVAWHESCCWWFMSGATEFVTAPSTDRIIAAVFGEPQGASYDIVKKQARGQLLHHIVNGTRISHAWLSASVNRVSNPFSYSKTGGGWDPYKWMNAVNVTCAIVRKYWFDKEEEFALEIETTRCDRDYLYGRLLAYADRIESHARFLQVEADDTAKRPTNAVRYMTAFAAKPAKIWPVIYHQLNPYLQRLKGGEWYQKEIDEIISLFPAGEFERNNALSGKYLLGYSLQRRALMNRKHKEDEQNAEQKD